MCNLVAIPSASPDILDVYIDMRLRHSVCNKSLMIVCTAAEMLCSKSHVERCLIWSR